jgi:hypothetical protein
LHIRRRSSLVEPFDRKGVQIPVRFEGQSGGGIFSTNDVAHEDQIGSFDSSQGLRRVAIVTQAESSRGGKEKENESAGENPTARAVPMPRGC